MPTGVFIGGSGPPKVPHNGIRHVCGKGFGYAAAAA